ncbi:hypothetical protein [Pseudonocardia acidicola]|uniref:Uncharacterized protein n=1 Tax=Pseudonocardia acidicola TaxID=2724939 RepID=A0ABX1SFD2_9PSEU|nr:hypothetical protein [Pseudonocardia acidicola]NMH99198.1 hypothetical protein [Pseudonocardia acidicola]
MTFGRARRLPRASRRPRPTTIRPRRRQRWDELDLPRLAALLGTVPVPEQPGIRRRIGDGALFLAGVFPEYAQRSLGLIEVARLQRTTGLRLTTADGDVCDLLEELAGGAYERSYIPGLFLMGVGIEITLTASVNLVQPAWPEDVQGDISGGGAACHAMI